MREEEVIAVCSVYIFDNVMNISRALFKIFRLRKCGIFFFYNQECNTTRLMGQVQLHEHISLICFQYGFIYRRLH